MSDPEGRTTTAKGYEQPNPDEVSQADTLFWESNMKAVSRFRKAVLVNLTMRYTARKESRYATLSEEEAWSKTKPFLFALLDNTVSFFVALMTSDQS